MKIVFSFLLLCRSFLLFSQDTTIVLQQDFSKQKALTETKEKEKKAVSLLIPASMITFGAVSLVNRGSDNINTKIKEELWTENPHKQLHIDNYLQFAPAVTVYGLNAIGIKGKNNFRDRSMIYLLSNVFVNGITYPLKKITHQMRPDGSNYNSFPSGHTAEAFASAEFLRQEYKDVSPLYGVAGYLMASTTGFLRMYNNKHWFGDVIAGAGIGMLSTKLAYWIYPGIKRKLFHDKEISTSILPFYQQGIAGLSFVHFF
jgi:hypothetical protein